jgi:hypothetical protein
MARGTCGVIAIIFGSALAHAAAADNSQSTLSRYREALSQQERIYAKISCQGKLTARMARHPEEPPHEMRLGLKQGDAGRLFSLRNLGTDASERVDFVNARYSASVARSDPSARYRLAHFGTSDEHMLDGNPKDLIALNIAAPCFIGKDRIADILGFHSFKLKSLSDVAEGGRTLKKLEFTYNLGDLADDRHGAPSPATIEFDPERGFATVLTEIGVGPARDWKRRTEIEYSARSLDGFPVPAVVRQISPDGRSEFVFEQFELREFPATDFSLSAFGLRELRRSAGDTIPGPWPWGFLVLGVIGLVLAALTLLLIRQRRIRPGPPATRAGA